MTIKGRGHQSPQALCACRPDLVTNLFSVDQHILKDFQKAFDVRSFDR
jgi:hypothetical protein